jgi:hypothetical protein
MEMGGRQRPFCLTRISPGEGTGIYSVPTEGVKDIAQTGFPAFPGARHSLLREAGAAFTGRPEIAFWANMP